MKLFEDFADHVDDPVRKKLVGLLCDVSNTAILSVNRTWFELFSREFRKQFLLCTSGRHPVFRKAKRVRLNCNKSGIPDLGVWPVLTRELPAQFFAYRLEHITWTAHAHWLVGLKFPALRSLTICIPGKTAQAFRQLDWSTSDLLQYHRKFDDIRVVWLTRMFAPLLRCIVIEAYHCNYLLKLPDTIQHLVLRGTQFPLLNEGTAAEFHYGTLPAYTMITTVPLPRRLRSLETFALVCDPICPSCFTQITAIHCAWCGSMNTLPRHRTIQLPSGLQHLRVNGSSRVPVLPRYLKTMTLPGDEYFFTMDRQPRLIRLQNILRASETQLHVGDDGNCYELYVTRKPIL